MKNRTKKGLAGAVILFIAFFSVMHLSLIWGIITTIEKEDTAVSIIEKIHEAYPKRLKHKFSFLNLNGFFARIIGRKVHNEIYRLRNGMLTLKYPPLPETASTEVLDMARFCREQGIEFLYIHPPYKVDLHGMSLPYGYSNEVNDAVSTMLETLRKESIPVKDLRPLLAATPEAVEKYFYRTDHHWNTDGAFLAYQEIVPWLAEQFPEKIPPTYTSYLNADSWIRTVYKNWFLGSEGKRVGRYFAGLDNIILYVPKFATQISAVNPKDRLLYKGDFTAAHIRQNFISECPNYYRTNPYGVYSGRDYPFVNIRNAGAPSPLKVLLIKDSFSLPLSAFLSTIFQEVDLVDFRHLKELTVAEYVLYTKPDIVLHIYNPSMFCQIDVKYELATPPSVPLFKREFFKPTIALTAPSENNFYFQAMNQIMSRDRLRNDTVYRFRASAISVQEGQTEGVSAVLYDLYEKKRHTEVIFDLDYCTKKNEFEWVFKTPPTGKWSLLLYSGIVGQTAGIGVTYHNVTLERDVSGDKSIKDAH